MGRKFWRKSEAMDCLSDWIKTKPQLSIAGSFSKEKETSFSSMLTSEDFLICLLRRGLKR